MFEKFKRWLTRQDEADAFQTRMTVVEGIVTELNDVNHQLRAENDQITTQLNTLQAERDKVTAKRNGTEPWVEITSADYDAVKGFRIELDWNEAFIQHLKESGLKGKTEEEVVKKWIGLLYGDLIEKLETSSIEKMDGKPTNDYI